MGLLASSTHPCPWQPCMQSHNRGILRASPFLNCPHSPTMTLCWQKHWAQGLCPGLAKWREEGVVFRKRWPVYLSSDVPWHSVWGLVLNCSLSRRDMADKEPAGPTCAQTPTECPPVLGAWGSIGTLRVASLECPWLPIVPGALTHPPSLNRTPSHFRKTRRC